ncbi:hypothetical protein GLOIN_2v1656551 [Rhizophagus irregularis DAOM 181602=DAOM 197198]|uniref:Uncharacterized protein n=1 Tax=Rhizophagus irregularis (strain DAOM 181602 / DAOM 197198 / MUCL 43194) TaxID=747089 RepID=A0A2P4PM56_RHIID|nr:hypothetical protein GLOIN_2v1656551 [Rhizophagus irregularis DAOM 181602=DAOM 197198]POG66468.1 hypothetical protein GLOIN_2v1656551 [Rhizophagus irregularis DAOM 181602=DAOM 197198]GET66808.1 hypothetical protein GLOIN_2v1656551 [Rhizophagus irregularis DAOM 181602=DAOM 197198]|eukprot:XP_025173334.1 hypothetical protein GLOIN_2v1656551 [Rhizophagus irregularis DAOM 181602=DAOM 197198]
MFNKILSSIHNEWKKEIVYTIIRSCFILMLYTNAIHVRYTRTLYMNAIHERYTRTLCTNVIHERYT